jgi:RNA polymerase sigma factor (sigma-70 family)
MVMPLEQGLDDKSAFAIQLACVEVCVWFYRRSSRNNGRLILEINDDLSGLLRRSARACGQPVEAYTSELLRRGLERESLQQAQVQAILEKLTPREREVTWLTARGYTNRQIAKELVISPETVKTHIRHVRDKLGVRNKADLRLLLLKLGTRGGQEPPPE